MILVSAEQWACLSSFCPFILFLAPSSSIPSRHSLSLYPFVPLFFFSLGLDGKENCDCQRKLGIRLSSAKRRKRRGSDRTA
ncbi:hypothetical protein V8C44DRAFT_320860 [Trichoderma aethiopicum]